MRLINADELPYSNIKTNEYGYVEVIKSVVLEESIANAQTVQAIPLEKVKQAKAEIKSISQEVPYKNQAFSYGVNICETSKVLKILDKLIGEVEE